jgi:hypothetical protein
MVEHELSKEIDPEQIPNSSFNKRGSICSQEQPHIIEQRKVSMLTSGNFSEYQGVTAQKDDNDIRVGVDTSTNKSPLTQSAFIGKNEYDFGFKAIVRK